MPRGNVCLRLSRIIHRNDNDIIEKKKKEKKRRRRRRKNETFVTQRNMTRSVLAIAPCLFFRSIWFVGALFTGPERLARSRFRTSFLAEGRLHSRSLREIATSHSHFSLFFFLLSSSRIAKLSPVFSSSRESFLFPLQNAHRRRKAVYLYGTREFHGRESETSPREYLTREVSLALTGRPNRFARACIRVSLPRVTVISNVDAVFYPPRSCTLPLSLSLSLSHLLSALHLSRLVHSAARSISICRFDRTKRKVNGVFPATNERSLDKPVVPIAPAISASEREKCRSRTGVTAKQPSMRIQNQCRERSPFRRWQSVPEPKSIGKDRPVAAFYVTLDRDRARVRVASQVEHCKSRRDAWTQSLSNVVDVARVSFVLLFEICLDTHAAPIGFSRFSRRNTVRRSFPFRLLQQSNRVTMKLDVSYTDHSHIIGKGGLTIKRVMEDTGCHIHFPDSNRSNHQEKSNQVSIAGEMEGVERARARVRVSQQIRRRF